MTQENKTTLVNLINICKNADVEILAIEYEEGCRGRVKATVHIKGSFVEISEKLNRLVKDLSPFIEDEYFGKWLNVSGTMDFYEFTGRLSVEVGFKGIGIELG